MLVQHVTEQRLFTSITWIALPEILHTDFLVGTGARRGFSALESHPEFCMSRLRSWSLFFHLL